MSIFCAKMVISAAPVFIRDIDKGTIQSVILQLEQEHSEGDSGKDLLKFMDYKVLNIQYNDLSVAPVLSFGISSAYLDQIKRYVDPNYPSVPTPPPNMS